MTKQKKQTTKESPLEVRIVRLPKDWIAILAFFLAMLTAFMLIYESYANRKHNRLSIKPSLNILYKSTDEPVLGFFLSNEGFGPAIIKKATITIDGKVIVLNKPSAWGLAFNALGIQEDIWPKINTYTYSRDASVGPDQYEGFLTVRTGTLSDEENNVFREASAKVKIDIDFESMYGEPGHICMDARTYLNQQERRNK